MDIAILILVETAMLRTQIRICTRLCQNRLLSTKCRPTFYTSTFSSRYYTNPPSNYGRDQNKVLSSHEKDSTAPLSNKLWTIPNIITISRIVTTPFIGYFIYNTQIYYALGLFTYSCLTDFIDGYIARRFHSKSSLGSILDPIADKLLMVTTTLSMSLPMGPHIIPVPIATIILGRDVILGASGVWIRYKTLMDKYGHCNWLIYWNMTRYPTVEVRPTRLSKWNTFFQMLYLAAGGVLLLVEGPVENPDGDPDGEKHTSRAETAFLWLGRLVALTTVGSGLSYWNTAGALRLIKK